MLQKLMPRGSVWTRDLDAELTALLQGLAVEHQRVDDRVIDLLEEYDPRTTDELLADWLELFGIEDDCTVPAVVATQREVLHQKMLGFGDPNLAFYQEQAETLGFTFYEIREYRPMSAGFAAGDHVIGLDWTFAWVLVVNARTAEINALLECTIEDLAPIHTKPHVYFLYYDDFVAASPAGGYSDDFRGSAGLTYSGSDIHLIVGDQAEIQRSTNGGKTWASITPAVAYAGDFYAACTYTVGAGGFYIFGTAGEIQRSANGGASWSHVAAAGGYANTFRGCCYNGSVVCVVGSAGEIQTATPPIGAFSAQSAAGGYVDDFRAAAADTSTGTMVIVGDSAEIQYSTDDGANWTVATPDTGPAAAAYAGDFLAATYANGFFWIAGSSGELQQSRDGITWRRIPNDEVSSYLAVYGDGLEGILTYSSTEGARVRTRVGPEMLFEDRTSAPAGTIRTILVFDEYCVLAGNSGYIAYSNKVGA
jgi:uncharacterized protein YmfQ (DUF2313 family)